MLISVRPPENTRPPSTQNPSAREYIARRALLRRVSPFELVALPLGSSQRTTLLVAQAAGFDGFRGEGLMGIRGEGSASSQKREIIGLDRLIHFLATDRLGFVSTSCT